MDPEFELLGDEPARLASRGDADPEVLDARPAESWRPPGWVTTVVVLALVVGAVAWYADERARVHESEALGACRRELHNAAISSDLLMVAVASSIRPSMDATTGSRRAAVVDLMSRPARRLLPDVVSADRLCRAVSVRPWHRSLRARRDAATAYSAALTAKLREVAADGRAYYDDDPSLRRLRRAADLGVFGGRY
ncbi:MAG TPA: hypothetical protein VHR85_08125 [Nocardioides sp.]|nr:hypothetical protein [Nocardioides sp.]